MVHIRHWPVADQAGFGAGVAGCLRQSHFSRAQTTVPDTQAAQQPIVVNPLLENVLLEVEEKVNCSLNRDGELSKFEVKGIIYITVNDPKKNNPAA